MQAIERKFEIEMKLEKEQNNLQKLKELSKRSSELSSGVSAVLGTCELRLQQLEKSVLPLYGDTAKLQQTHLNLERSVQALDHLIGYYLVARELADLINSGPNTTSPDTLNEYLEALDRLTEAQVYFQKNNPQSVELENISSLYNSGVSRLEAAISELLTRYSRPMPLNTLLSLMEQDDSAVVEFAEGAETGAARAGAGWLWANRGAAAAPGAAARARAPNALRALNAFRDHLRREAPANAGERSKPVHRSDSTVRKTSSRLHKAIEKKANKMLMLASHTIEQSTGLAIGSRRSLAIPEGEASGGGGGAAEAEGGEGELAVLAAAQAGALALAVARLLRAEQAALLAVLPPPALPLALAAVAHDLLAALRSDAERAWTASRRCAGASGAAGVRGAGAGAGWAALAALAALRGAVERALAPAPLAPYDAILGALRAQGLRTLEDWVETLRTDNSPGPVDGTVQQLAAETLALLQKLAAHQSTVGAALSTEAAYCRAPVITATSSSADLPKRALALYMRKVLAQLNHTIRNKSEQYNDPPLRAIFRLNNAHYLLLGLQRNGLIEILSIAEPDSEQNYQDMIQEHRKAYLQCWSRIITYITLEEPLSGKMKDKEKQMLKDKFSNFNREIEEAFRMQRGYSVPDAELRESLKRDNKERLLPAYTRIHADASATQNAFSRHPEKYLKYSPHQLASLLDSFFDTAA